MTARPLGERVMVRSLEADEKVTDTGIILQGTAAASAGASQRGEVVSVGDHEEIEVKVGQTVLFSKYGATELDIDGEKLLLLRNSDLLAIVED